MLVDFWDYIFQIWLTVYAELLVEAATAQYEQLLQHCTSSCRNTAGAVAAAARL